MTLLVRIITSVVALAVVPASSLAQAQSTVTATSAYSTVAPGTTSAKGRWDITYTFSGLCPTCGEGAVAQVVIDVRPAVVLSVLEDRDQWLVTASATGAPTFTRRGASSGSVVLRVRAEALLSQVTAGVVNWTGRHSGLTADVAGAIEGPVAAAAPTPRWSTLVGGGFSFLRDDYTDFDIEDDILVIKNDSQWRATALTGIGFEVGKKVGLLVGLEYTAGTSALVDAFTAGISYRMGSDASLVFGISRAKGRELSAGFERAAAAHVSANAAKFPAISARSDGQGLERPTAYDGLPIKDIAYAGRTITDSWNAHFFVGVTFPISIKLGFDKDLKQLAKDDGKK
jgi:hypothetical protein